MAHIVVVYHGRICKAFTTPFKTQTNIFYAMNIGTQFLCCNVQNLFPCFLFIAVITVFTLMCHFRYWISLNVVLHALHTFIAVFIYNHVSSIDFFYIIIIYLNFDCLCNYTFFLNMYLCLFSFFIAFV